MDDFGTDLCLFMNKDTLKAYGRFIVLGLDSEEFDESTLEFYGVI